ncbi:(2Fe-2S)-binding protein [Skermanella stibiiresistens]|uniref:(2Fe-2S)-binding protein n=1 Tax=Skermanella stibiiresistens TaxID=913326 RepID=UPI00056B925E|nr:(2Fe-2S)-binding protein [Skermanella stibiiresistens]
MGTDTREIRVTVNGAPTRSTVPVRLLLSDFLRDVLGLTGTHVGCGQGPCGSCTVLADGDTVRSCLMLAVQADGMEIETIEGVAAADGTPHRIQEAFREHHALQCGFCTPGIVMATVGLLRRTPCPSAAERAELMEGHLCRCTGYRNIDEALAALSGAEPRGEH